MAWIEVEPVWKAISKNIKFTLIGATIGLIYGCSREGAYCNQRYREKLDYCNKQLEQIVPKENYKDLERIIYEAKKW